MTEEQGNVSFPDQILALTIEALTKNDAFDERAIERLQELNKLARTFDESPIGCLRTPNH